MCKWLKICYCPRLLKFIRHFRLLFEIIQNMLCVSLLSRKHAILNPCIRTVPGLIFFSYQRSLNFVFHRGQYCRCVWCDVILAWCKRIPYSGIVIWLWGYIDDVTRVNFIRYLIQKHFGNFHVIYLYILLYSVVKFSTDIYGLTIWLGMSLIVMKIQYIYIYILVLEMLEKHDFISSILQNVEC